MSKVKVFFSTTFIFVYNFQDLESTVILWYTRSSQNLLRVIEKDLIL